MLFNCISGIWSANCVTSFFTKVSKALVICAGLVNKNMLVILYRLNNKSASADYMKKIGIISLGLIGGSLFKCLIQKGYDVCAVTRNKETIIQAKELSVNVSDDINTLKNCDVIFVCSPMSKCEEILDNLENIIPQSTIVADVCSLKSFLMNKKRPYVFIGSHPMAGTEHSGYDASFAELFENAKWVITPRENTPEESVQILSQVIQSTGAKIIRANAQEHDKAAALISHMPMVIAQALMKTIQNNELAKKMASSGFRDMTRLALSNLQMAEDMVNLNKENILESIKELTQSTDELLLDSYTKQILDIKNARQSLYNADGKNTYN